MREQEFANWFGRQVKSTGEPYAESVTKSYIGYLRSIEKRIGNIDDVSLANAETYLEQIKSSFPDLTEHSRDSYCASASLYFDFRRDE